MKVNLALSYTLCGLYLAEAMPPKPKVPGNLSKVLGGSTPPSGSIAQMSAPQTDVSVAPTAADKSSDSSSLNKSPAGSAKSAPMSSGMMGSMPPVTPQGGDPDGSSSAPVSKILPELEKLNLDPRPTTSNTQPSEPPDPVGQSVKPNVPVSEDLPSDSSGEKQTDPGSKTLNTRPSAGSVQSSTGSPPTSPIIKSSISGKSPQSDPLLQSGTIASIERSPAPVSKAQALEFVKQVYESKVSGGGSIVMVGFVNVPGVGNVRVSKPRAGIGQDPIPVVNAILELAKKYAPRPVKSLSYQAGSSKQFKGPKIRDDIELIHVEDYAYIKVKQLLAEANSGPVKNIYGVLFGRPKKAVTTAKIIPPCGEKPLQDRISMEPGCWPSQEKLGLISWATSISGGQTKASV
ncbi:hypothetical protein KVT40_000385 [Elsinoe batatas]|uniref:Uncharacterized protein n=1 Tax=Elsinoe batatas TaxID=2601811 RepID=A0A8K0PGD7_9PEZI|nr:hypothetical protein KVT40_000385 [Elsinoe batatas]